MRSFRDTCLTFLRSEEGPTAVEYAVMLALIIVVCITAIGGIGTKASEMWGSDQSQIQNAFPGGS